MIPQTLLLGKYATLPPRDGRLSPTLLVGKVHLPTDYTMPVMGNNGTHRPPTAQRVREGQLKPVHRSVLARACNRRRTAARPRASCIARASGNRCDAPLDFSSHRRYRIPRCSRQSWWCDPNPCARYNALTHVGPTPIHRPQCAFYRPLTPACADAPRAPPRKSQTIRAPSDNGSLQTHSNAKAFYSYLTHWVPRVLEYANSAPRRLQLYHMY